MSFRTHQGRLLGLVLLIILFIALLPSDRLSYSTSFVPLPLKKSARSPKWPSLTDRMALSEDSWSKSLTLRHQMAATHPNNPHIPFFPKDFLKYPWTIWDFFPATYTCPHDMQRVGRLGDGGKWVCGMSIYETLPAPLPASKSDISNSEVRRAKVQDAAIGTGLVIYSFGINGESSFEADMLSRIPSASMWGYDFSVEGWGAQIPAEHRNRTYFTKLGLGSTDEPSRVPPFYTLPTLMSQNNHTYIDILKIDVEGAEYKALDTMMDVFAKVGDSVLPIGQVMIELHVADGSPVGYERFSSWWERLEKMGMRPTWMEINLFAVTLGNQKSDPRCAEYVWINAKDRRNVLWRQ